MALVLAIFLLLSRGSAQAHPEHLGQASYLTLGPSNVALELEQSPGPGVAARVVARMDSDRDGVLSPEERQAYAGEVLAAQRLWLDGGPVSLLVARAEIPAAEQLLTGQAKIRLVFAAHPPPLSPGKHSFTLENRHEPAPVSCMAHAFGDDGVYVNRQERDALQKRLDVEVTVVAPAATRGGRPGKPRSSDAAGLGLGALIGVLSLSWRWREARRSAA
jgi:hypothetical protein